MSCRQTARCAPAVRPLCAVVLAAGAAFGCYKRVNSGSVSKPAATPKNPKPRQTLPECFAGAVVALDFGGDSELPARLKIAPWGQSQTDSGPVVVNHATMEALRKNNKHPFDTVVLDFCHGTEKKEPHPIPTAAYGQPEVVPGEGLFLTNMQWTPDGQKAWKGQWYKDVSPTIARNKAGEVIFVKSAALCFNGRIPGAENFDASTLHPQDEPTYPIMKKTVLALLAKAGVTLPDDATDEQIAAAADKLDSPPSQPDGGSEDFSAKLEGFEAKLKALEETTTKQNADAASAVKQALLDQATRDGQVVPFSNEVVMAETFSVEILREAIKNLPKNQVPFKAGTAGAVQPPNKAEAFSAEEKHIFAKLGLDEETIQKFGCLPDNIGNLKEIPAP